MLIYSLSIYLYQSNKLSVCAVYDQAITILGIIVRGLDLKDG